MATMKGKREYFNDGGINADNVVATVNGVGCTYVILVNMAPTVPNFDCYRLPEGPLAACEARVMYVGVSFLEAMQAVANQAQADMEAETDATTRMRLGSPVKVND